MNSLYELSEGYMRVLNLAETDSENDVIKDTLDSINDDFDLKAESIAKIDRSLRSDIKAVDEEINRLQAIRKSKQNKQKYLKQYLQENMELIGKSKIKSPLFTIYIGKNAKSVQIIDESLIPEQFKKTVESVDKQKLKEALSTSEVAGAKLIQTESLKIR